MNKYFNIFNEIKKHIIYIINDSELIFSNNFFLNINEKLCVLKKKL